MTFLRVLGSLVLALPMTMFAQSDVTYTSAQDGNFAVNYASNLERGDGVVNVTNTGASAGTRVPLVGRNSYGDICVNAYVYAPDQELAACCTCKVTPNSLHSWPVYFGSNSLLANQRNQNILDALRGGLNGNLSVVIKLYATVASGISGNDPNSSTCPNPGNVVSTIGRATTGMVAWATHSHPTNTTAVAITETPFVNSTLSTGEYGKLIADCNNLQGGGSTRLCPGCQYGGLDASLNTAVQ
ncbi:MAG: hypothetical protein ACJ746_29980 [Bryobacteraceae bacterium]